MEATFSPRHRYVTRSDVSDIAGEVNRRVFYECVKQLLIINGIYYIFDTISNLYMLILVAILTDIFEKINITVISPHNR